MINIKNVNMILAAFLILLGCIILITELLIPYPVPLLVYLLVIFTAIVLCLTSWRKNRIYGIAAVLVAIFSSSILYRTAWNDRKRIIAAKRQMNDGISHSEVVAIANAHRLKLVNSQDANDQHSMTFVPSSDGKFNSDLLIVYFRNGIVSATEFYAD